MTTVSAPNRTATLLHRMTSWRAWLVVAVLYVAFLFPSPEYNAYNKDDASWFVTLAMNIVEHGRYTVDTYPREAYGRHASWPFLFPWLLASVIALFGVSWVALKATMVSLGLIHLYLLDRLWKGSEQGRIAVLVTALSPTYFLFSHVTMTEIPFMVACTSALMLVNRTISLPGSIAAGMVAAAAFLVRGYGMTLLPTGILCYCARHTWPWKQRVLCGIGFSLPLAAAMVGWFLYTRAISSAGVPLDWLSSHFGTGAHPVLNALRPSTDYVREIYWYHLRFPLHFLFPILPLHTILQLDFSALPTLGFLTIALYGWLIKWKEQIGAVEVWLPFNFALMLLSVVSYRYWLTPMPFVIFYFMVGTAALSRWSPRWTRLYPVVAMTLVAFVSLGLARHLAQPDTLRFFSPYWREYRDLAVWAGQNLPQDAVVLTHHSQNFMVTSERRSYRLEDLRVAHWPIQELRSEPHIYVVCPTLDQPEHVPAEAIAACRLLLATTPSTVMRAGQHLALYHLSVTGSTDLQGGAQALRP